MKPSRTSIHAVRALIHIASQKSGQFIIGHQFARRHGFSKGALLRTLVMLSRARILWAVKGPAGGYRLARRAEEITLLEVVETIDERPGREQFFVPERLT